MNRAAARLEREYAWRAIAPNEESYLEDLALTVRRLRADAGLSRAALATAMRRRSDLGLRHIERAERRTRYSTLRRMARALALRLGRDAADVFDELCRAAGPTISPERGTFPTGPYLGRRRPFYDPDTGEFIGFEGATHGAGKAR